MAFVTAHGRSGRVGVATVIEDGDAGEGDDARASFAKALRAIGADFPAGDLDPALARTVRPPERGAELDLATLLEYCHTAGPPYWIATFSGSVDRAVRFTDLPSRVEAVLGPASQVTTPREFAGWLMSKLDPQSAGYLKKKESGHILRRSPPERTLVLLVGSPDLSPVVNNLKALGAAEIALIVDLSEAGVESDIRRLLDSPDRTTLYWRPIAD